MQALDNVQSNLDGLATSCNHISATLGASRAASGPLLADTDKLSKDLTMAEQRSAMVKEFLEQYQLAPEEVRRRVAQAGGMLGCTAGGASPSEATNRHLLA